MSKEHRVLIDFFSIDIKVKEKKGESFLELVEEAMRLILAKGDIEWEIAEIDECDNFSEKYKQIIQSKGE